MYTTGTETTKKKKKYYQRLKTSIEIQIMQYNN